MSTRIFSGIAMLKLSVCCCTFNRPEFLGELIHSFQIQTYPKEHCELIVLDDSGQYGDLRGENWQIVSFPRRFASLGEKRNACVSLTSHESEYFVVADDDDIYLPWWLESHARNFRRGALWSFASSIFWSEENRIVDHWHYSDERWIMHPAHAFHKQTFWDMGGYPPLAWMEDHFLFEKYRQAEIEHHDALQDADGKLRDPYLIFRRHPTKGHAHATRMQLEQYRLHNEAEVRPASLEIGWRKDHLAEAENFLKSLHNESIR